MARIPDPPELNKRQTFLGRVLYFVIGFPIALWIFWQLFWMFWIAVFTWMDYAFGEGASQFMYEDLQAYWNKWGDWIMPWWFFHIPTWRHDWYALPLMAFLIYFHYGGKLPRFQWKRKKSFSNEPPKDSPYNQKKQKKSQERKTAGSTDDDFGFDPNAFKGGNNQQKQEPPRDKPKPDDKFKEALELFEMKMPFTLDELKKRRKQLLAKTHPDVGGSSYLFKQVENAFEILKRNVH